VRHSLRDAHYVRPASILVQRFQEPAKTDQDVYIAHSWWLTGWSAPQNMGDAVNTTGVEQRATLSAVGKRMYFGRDGDIYVSQRAGRN
jgi:hypothetical protein